VAVVGLVLVAGGDVGAGGSAAGGDHRTATVLLAGISVAATLAYLAAFVALHVLPTGYNPVRHAVSDYAVGRYATVFRAALYASSVGGLGLAFALMLGVGSPPLTAWDLAYLLLIPLFRIGMSLFPTSLEGEPLTRTGAWHYVCAIAAFTFTYLVLSDTTSLLQRLARGSWLRDPLGWCGWVVAPALFLVVVTMLPRLRRVFGLCERLFLVTTNVWFVLAAVLLIQRAA
jgi:hypothetical protein